MKYNCEIINIDEDEVTIRIGDVCITGFVNCGVEKKIGQEAIVEILLYDDLEIMQCDEKSRRYIRRSTLITMKEKMKMTDRFNRDEMFYRLAHLNVGIEKKEEVLKDLKKVSNPNFQDSQGTSYLHMACQVHSVEAISILLDLGADANISDKRGFSPILSVLDNM